MIRIRRTKSGWLIMFYWFGAWREWAVTRGGIDRI